MSSLKLATFRVDVTPPTGHPLCAGWVSPALGVTDPLYADGLVITDGEQTVLLCAIDWCEISNRTYIAWKAALAHAVGTTLDHVSIHCMHPHCTPWPDEEAQRLVEPYPEILPIMDVEWCASALDKIAAAAAQCLSTLRPVTHIATGRGRVEQVASNRRVMGDDGKVKAVRWTRTFDPEVRAEPEGQIDPDLKTISFWDGSEKLVALHYYAVHPSSYEDCFVTPDFTGLARERRIAEDGGVTHFYFTECAGDITAGKYNDGARELREVFTQRVHRAMTESENAAQRRPLQSWNWTSVPIQLPPRPDHSPEYLHAVLSDPQKSSKERGRAALALAYHERGDVPIDIGALHLNDDVLIVHLPGEAFMEYQHFAHAQRPDAFVAVPSYGDCGPGYICLEKSFDEGGYEPTDSFVASCSETILKDAIARVLQKPAHPGL